MFYSFIKYLKQKQQLLLGGGPLFSCTFSYCKKAFTPIAENLENKAQKKQVSTIQI